jgi:hypothetical protein
VEFNAIVSRAPATVVRKIEQANQAGGEAGPNIGTSDQSAA